MQSTQSRAIQLVFRQANYLCPIITSLICVLCVKKDTNYCVNKHDMLKGTFVYSAALSLRYCSEIKYNHLQLQSRMRKPC